MDTHLIKAVIKTNIVEKHPYNKNKKGSVISLSSIDDDDGEKSCCSLRSPDGPLRGRSVKEFEEQLGALKKENFNLKLRIYFLEERMGANFSLDKENIVKNNVELMVEVESLKKELQEKHELLCQAVKAMDLEEDEFKKTAQSKNDEIANLKQEIEELKLQLQDVRFENDNESTHKSYHSEPIYFSSQMMSESNSRMRMFQERIHSLESELIKEKENSASLQMVLDQGNLINTKYEQLLVESEKKDQSLNNLMDEMQNYKEKINNLSIQVSDLENFRDVSKTEIQTMTRLVEEKSKSVKELEEQLADAKKKYINLKTETDKEKQKYDKNKLINEIRIAEMNEELDKQKGRVQDLQKKLGLTHQELTENQKLLVPKSPNFRSIATNTDFDNVSVSNAATSFGIQKEDALCDALNDKASPKSPVAIKTFDFTNLYKILDTVMFSSKPQVMKQLEQLKDILTKSQQKIVYLKAQELKACVIIKNLMQYHKNSEQQIVNSKKRIEELEKELEGVVTKPEGKSRNKDDENSEENKNEIDYKAFLNELETKIKILELTLKEKDLHIEYIEGKNLELLNNIHGTDEENVKNVENIKQITNEMYNKIFEEKNKEIDKLNKELWKRTHDLQGVVNNELWQKNREIEKLQIKYGKLLEDKEKEMVELKESFSTLSSNLEELKTENEDKHIENSNLKIDISDLKLQLQLLREKIGEIGLISNDKLELELIMSSLDDVKNIQKELQDVKSEKQILIKKINELENTTQSVDQFTDYEKLKSHLEMSEILRSQSNQACHILKLQLEELALFLDSLMKQKSVLGFLGSTQNKKLREAIDLSLDLSKTLNMSLVMNPEESLLQLSNISSLLNNTDANTTVNDDNNRYSFSLLPEQATLSYPYEVTKDKDGNQSFMLKALKDQIEMLQRELKIKNNELIRYRRESKNMKDLRLTKPRVSPNKLKSAFREVKIDSESETWSEPDVNVSKARIGLFKEDTDSFVGIEEIQFSDSTDDSLTNLNRKKSDILDECQLTITKFNKQVLDLQAKLKEKENICNKLQEINESNNFLRDDNEKLTTELIETKKRLELIEKEKLETEKMLEKLKSNINDLEKSKNSMMDNYNLKDKEMCNEINQMKFEREQLVNMAKEYANMAENSRLEIIELENKLTEITIEKENIEKEFNRKFEDSEKEKFETISKIELDMNENYIKKSEVDEILNKLDNLKSELKMLKETIEDNNISEKKMKDEINCLQTKLNQEIINYSEIILEKSELEHKLDEIKNYKTELQVQLDDNKDELLSIKEQHKKEVDILLDEKSRLELKISELEFSKADLHNKFVKLNLGDVYSNFNGNERFTRQFSNNSQSYISEDDVKTRGMFSIVVPQKSVDSDRIEANSSPDLGIESDQGRFSSLEVQTQVDRPLLPTIELAESMSNMLDGDNNSVCGNKFCHKKSLEMVQENNTLKKKLVTTQKALEDTITQLKLANQRKKLIEKNICKQIYKTNQVLREAKANLDSGSETDFLKK